MNRELWEDESRELAKEIREDVVFVAKAAFWIVTGVGCLALATSIIHIAFVVMG